MINHAFIAERFMRIRAAICEIEHELGADHSPDDIKEYDKSVVVMKVGAKLMKRELGLHGYVQLGKRAKERVQ